MALQKRKLRIYKVKVRCPQLKRQRTYRFKTFSSKRAWDIARWYFCDRFPEVFKLNKNTEIFGNTRVVV